MLLLTHYILGIFVDLLNCYFFTWLNSTIIMNVYVVDITFYAYLLPFSSANSFSQSLNVTLLMKGFAVVTPKKITANSLRTHRNCLSFGIVNHFQFSQGCGLSLLIFWLFLCLKTWTECCLTTWSWKWTHMNRWR